MDSHHGSPCVASETDPRRWLTLPLRAWFDGQFSEEFFGDNDERTRREINFTLNLWEKIVDAAPPLGSITSSHLAKFRDDLRRGKFASRATLATRSPSTVNKHLRHVNELLNKAGPRGPRNKDAFGILPVVPWCRPLHVDEKSIKTVGDEDLVAFWQAADVAKLPRIDGVSPGDFWRSLVIVALTAIVRRGALLNSLRWKSIDLAKRWVTIEGEGDKVGRVRCKRLHTLARDALLRIRHGGEFVFPWAYSETAYYDTWHAISNAAKTDFGLHDLKRTALSRLARKVDSATLQKLGDHSSLSTTLRYYTHVGDERMAAAIDGFDLPFEMEFSPNGQPAGSLALTS